MKRAFALPLVAALALFGLVACQPTKPSAPVYICSAEGGSPPDTAAAATAADGDAPLAPEAAGEEAKEAFAESEVRTEDGRVPIVTLEEGPNGPEIVSTPVASEAEAEVVAEQAAADGDLVTVEADSIVTADALPDDDEFDDQYAFSYMNFLGAWDVSGPFPGNLTLAGAGAGQTVAIIDTGVQATHLDLDDGRVLAGASFRPAGEQPATVDLGGHGTRLAGIVAAETNNAIGIVGAAPAARILPVKVLNPGGSGFSSDVANGIMWAATSGGATVINLSLGGANPSQIQHDVIRHVVLNLGIPVIASSGNDGKCGPASFPAAFAEVLAVGAIDQNANRASFSTTGPYVSVVAPGAAIVSTWPFGAPPNDVYNFQNGTSFSAPYVAAIAAIVRATHPGFVASDVYAQIVQTAIDLPPAVGWDPDTGFGLADPYAAAWTN